MVMLASCTAFPNQLNESSSIMSAEEIANDAAETAVYNMPPVLYGISLVGLHERHNRNELTEFLGIDPAEIAWCAAFVNSVLRVSGIEGTDSNLARSFVNWGEEADEPEIGDIVVFSRPPVDWQGHVGFFINSVTIDGVEYYRVLGGNQSDSISIDLYPVSRLLSIRKI